MTTAVPDHPPINRPADDEVDSFPRQYARTQRLTLGEPRNVLVANDAVLFLRSSAGDDPVNQLWRVDLSTGDESLLVDPAVVVAHALGDLGGDDTASLSDAERARRERMREGAGGITAYSTDRDASHASFALAGALFVTEVGSATTTHFDVPGPVFDPHLSPDGDQVAYVCGRSLYLVNLATSKVVRLAGDDAAEDDEPTVSWGSADFVAAEEMHRFRGFWWAPDGKRLAVCRVDESMVDTWHIADPATPSAPPRVVRYPAAGTPNPRVGLFVLEASADATPVPVQIDNDEWPYLATVSWNEHGLVAVVQNRSQRDVHVLGVDPDDGATSTIWSDHDDAWVELVPGSGAAVGPGRVVMCADRDGARRLAVVAAGEATLLSPPDVQVRSVLATNEQRIIVTGNPLDDATVLYVYVASLAKGDFTALVDDPGVHTAAVGESDNGDDTIVIRHADLTAPGGRWVLPSGTPLISFAEAPLVRPQLTLLSAGTDALATAVLLPYDHDGSPLPVLLDPYGGPHAQRVVRSYNAFAASQWFADQGFAVVITDGRGTPGRGTVFERAVYHDLANGVLDDQIAGLQAAAEQCGVLDLQRVAIRGWSFGGYLAALAVLRRPDVFHAAIAGAPVTEWRLYDTHYTERYLGDPTEEPDVYDANSLLPLAADLTRPLLLIHGLADDNVVAAHTLQLSSALLGAGRSHEVLPLVGVTHMTPQEVVAENLLLHQLSFLRRALGLAPPTRTNVD